MNEMHWLISNVCRTLNMSMPDSATLGRAASLDSSSSISPGISIPIPRFALNLERVESVEEDIEETKEKTVSPPNVSDEENLEVDENESDRSNEDTN